MRHLAILPMTAALACASELPPEPDFSPELRSSDEAVLWQGLDHAWTYNHRWGRLGSGFVRIHPEQSADAWPVEESPLSHLPGGPVWTYMGTAGAGTGLDIGQHRATGLRLEDPAGDVQFSSTTAHRRLTGSEGQLLESPLSLSLDLPESQRVLAEEDGAEVAVLLNGFWLKSVGDEAKKPVFFELSVGEAEVVSGALEVTVDLSLAADCDTPECMGCTAKPFSQPSEELAYDVWVDLVVVVGADGDFATTRHRGPDSQSDWDGPPSREGTEACLEETMRQECWDYWIDCGEERLAEYASMSPGAGREPLRVDVPDGLGVGVLGLSGLSLSLDEAHHMVSLEVGTGPVSQDGNELSAEPVLRFQNWSPAMNTRGRDADVRASTAFGTEGAFAGRVDLVALGFRDVVLTPVEIDETVITEASQQVLVEL